MRTLETVATVTPDGTLTVQVPPDVPPGEHRVVVVIEEQPQVGRRTLDLPVLSVGHWPEGLSLRREEMYGDWGR
jgi:hypothetical protein